MTRTVLFLFVTLFLSCSRGQQNNNPPIITTPAIEPADPVQPIYIDRPKPVLKPNLLSELGNETQIKTSHFWHRNDGVLTHQNPSESPLFSEQVSYRDNDGSFLLVNTKDNYSSDQAYDQLLLKETFYSVPLEANTVYTFSFMALVESACPAPGVFVNLRGDHKGTFGSFHIESIFLKDKNTWQEVIVVFKSPNVSTNLSFQITNFRSHEGYNCIQCSTCNKTNDDCWPIYIDDFYLAEGVSYRESPKPKSEYKNDPLRRIDRYGNIELKQNGNWTPFFPLMVYSHNARLKPGQSNDPQVFYSNTPNDTSDDGYKLYKKMGFNTVAWASARFSLDEIIKAELYGNIDLTYYGTSLDERTLIDDIKFLQQKDKEKHILFYYHDHEDNFTRDYIDWQSFISAAKKSTDVPIYQLNGNPGNVSRYNNESCQLVDVTGTYYGSNNDRFVMSDHSNLINVPTIMAQINTPLDEHIRPYIYHAISAGAKGVGYFRDEPYLKKDGLQVYNSKGDIKNAIWFEDFKNISDEIEAMLPIIRQAHWTDWTIELTGDQNNVKFGTRQYENQAYIFLSNYAKGSRSVEITLSDIDLKTNLVEDFHSGETRATVRQNKFNIFLEPNEGCLLKLDASF